MAGRPTYLTRAEEQLLQRHNQAFVVRTPAMEIFWKKFRLPKLGDVVTELTATEIFTTLQKAFPAALRGMTPAGFGRQLRGLGLQCIHSKRGNCYHVVECQAEDNQQYFGEAR